MVQVASIFTQALSLIFRRNFAKSVRQHQPEKGSKGFSCWDQFVAMLFSQLGGANSLWEICGCLVTAMGKTRLLGSNLTLFSKVSELYACYDGNQPACIFFGSYS